MVSEGPSLLSSLYPLLHLNLLSGQVVPKSLGQSLVKMVMTAMYKTISGFLLVQLHCISKRDNVADPLICSTKTTGGSWVFCGRLNFLLSFRLGHLESSLCFIALHMVADSDSEGPVILQFLGGKQIHWGLRMSYV